MTGVYEGHSVFSIFEDKLKFHQEIVENLNNRKFQQEKDVYDNYVDNALLRKISMILNMPTIRNISSNTTNGKTVIPSEEKFNQDEKNKNNKLEDNKEEQFLTIR